MRLGTWVSIVLLGVLGGQAHAGMFTITNLGSAAYDTEALAINANGTAAITPFMLGQQSVAYGINDNGLVAGTLFGPDGAQAMFSQDGVAWAVPGLTGESYAKGVNNAGQVVGSNGGKAYLAHNGNVTYLTHPIASLYDIANAINENGAIAGTLMDEQGTWRAYAWYNGQTVWTGSLGGQNSFGTNLNEAGQFTGYGQTAEGWTHAFIAHEGLTIDLGTLGGTCSYAYGINNNGDVVGYSYRNDGTMGAFLSLNGVMLDLSQLVVGAEDWLLNAAYGINDLGQIVGTGFYNGRRTAFRLDPLAPPFAPAHLLEIEDVAVPEPSTGLLILAGLAGVFLTGRRGDTGKTH